MENPNEMNIVANEKNLFDKVLKAVQIEDKSTLALIDTRRELKLLRWDEYKQIGSPAISISYHGWSDNSIQKFMF